MDAQVNTPISFSLSEEGLEHAVKLMEIQEIPSDIKHILKIARKSKSIDLPELIKVFEWRCQKHNKGDDDDEDPRVFPLLDKVDMILPELPKRKPNPELQERLKRLAAKQKNAEYEKMVKNVSAAKYVAPEHKSTKSSVISGLNFVLTMFASCGASVYLLQYYFPDVMVRVGIGLVIGTILVVIEIFLAVREIEQEQKKNK